GRLYAPRPRGRLRPRRLSPCEGLGRAGGGRPGDRPGRAVKLLLRGEGALAIEGVSPANRAMTRIISLALAAAIAAAPGAAFAWANAGHRMLGEAAMRALPSEAPAFLRTRHAIVEVGELSREPDRSKGAGRIHDQDRDPAHFVDLGEDGKILGGPPFLPLPPTRAEYEKGLQAAGIDSWKAG